MRKSTTNIYDRGKDIVYGIVMGPGSGGFNPFGGGGKQYTFSFFFIGQN